MHRVSTFHTPPWHPDQLRSTLNVVHTGNKRRRRGDGGASRGCSAGCHTHLGLNAHKKRAYGVQPVVLGVLEHIHDALDQRVRLVEVGGERFGLGVEVRCLAHYLEHRAHIATHDVHGLLCRLGGEDELASATILTNALVHVHICLHVGSKRRVYRFDDVKREEHGHLKHDFRAGHDVLVPLGQRRFVACFVVKRHECTSVAGEAQFGDQLRCQQHQALAVRLGRRGPSRLLRGQQHVYKRSAYLPTGNTRPGHCHALIPRTYLAPYPHVSVAPVRWSVGIGESTCAHVNVQYPTTRIWALC
eukprot:m.638691 g.638691  ORF g.638691 m.638691 type:complete len:302 (+) comp22607_c0_seq14:1697-2602(+)